MSLLITSLYFLCFLLLTSMVMFVLGTAPRSRLHRAFALSALALLAWQGTLFTFNRLAGSAALTLVGRFNFASAAFVTLMAYLLVAALAGKRSRWHAVLVAETLALSALIVLTPLLDRAEVVQAGQHVTLFGPLFGLYVSHVLLFVLAAVYEAFAAAKQSPDLLSRQLRIVGLGILGTAAVALVTDVLLPYGFHVFSLQDVGTLSTLLFLIAVGYAVFAYHLFQVRVIVRATFVLTGLVALALEVYQLALSFLVHLLPLGNAGARNFAATALVLTVNAFTQQPVRQWLEKMIDHPHDQQNAAEGHPHVRRVHSAAVAER